MDNEIRLTDLIGPAFYGLHHSIRREEYTDIWLPGGRASLKSSWWSLEGVQELLRDPMANMMVLRKVAETLRSSVYPQVEWAIEKLGLTEYFRFGLSPMEITYKPTGQKIMFRGADRPEKLKSIKLKSGYFKIVVFEETPEFNGMEEIRMIEQSLIRGVPRAFSIKPYNPPKTQSAWVNEEVLIPKKNRIVLRTNYLQVPPDWLGAAFLEEAAELKRVNERAYLNEYMGEVTGTGGNVFENVTIRKITKEERATFDRYYNGLDFGFSTDPAALVRMHYHKPTRRLYILDEVYGVRMANATLAEKTKALCGREIVTCDSEDTRTINEMVMLGVNAIAAKKGPDSIRHGMRWLENLAEIVIDEDHAPNAAREFKGYEFERDKHGNFIARYPDEKNHTIDAVRYGMESVSAQRQATTISREGLGL